MIRPVTLEDAAVIADIYNYYIVNTAISFEEILITPLEMENRIRNVTSKFPWLVAEENGVIEGYAYLSTWKERAAYRHTAEVSIYLRFGSEGRGIGSMLLKRLLKENEKSGIHVLIASITLPNLRSVALHEKFGFKKVGHFHEVGFKMNQWVDVGNWELVLGRSKYNNLWKYIQQSGNKSLKLSFDEIKNIAGIDIDHSFLNYKKELLQYGYQAGKISLKEKTVEFNKID
ncbi:MAG: GNAT family N-acetyltransferase [Campylobacteraceae bacterium]|nr:GNAT family N-acetyltransferase [Campylobacteraceae bacterium]